MEDINLLAVLVAGLASFVIGGIWYSPMLFGNRWCQEVGMDPQEGHSPQVFVFALMFSLIAAVVFALFLGPAPALPEALHYALLVGLGFVATSFGINYRFSHRSFALWAIDSGYHVFQFVVFAVILGLWH